MNGPQWCGTCRRHTDVDVIKVERSGYVLCRIHTDSAWDFGRQSARIMPEQTVAVKTNRVRPRRQEECE
jgi:hypothetical protein